MIWFLAAIQRTNVSRVNRDGLRNMTFKVESRENEYIGIDLKKVSLKRKIKNDDSTTEVSPKMLCDMLCPIDNLQNKFLDRWARSNQENSRQ